MSYLDSAPSNIALIKYMGKTDHQQNLACNDSLSYTLNHLTSTVKIELSDSNHDSWQPLDPENPLKLSKLGQTRFLNFFAKIKSFYNYQGNFIISSANNFPHGCGLASSASSFAALTKCANKALADLSNTPLPSRSQQAMQSRAGSGSSCRSFFSPWALWQQNDVKAVDLPYSKLHHQVIILSDKEKNISSSQAHQIVRSSPHFEGREQRANQRLQQLLSAFNAKQWQTAFQICWDEFIDMHQLFQTASDPFDYMTAETHHLLNALQHFWQTNNSGPLVTMDAGPNIHLLYRPQDLHLKKAFEATMLTGKYRAL